MQLLFLHGALGSKSQFDSLLARLPNTIEGHSMNFSGHGGRPVALGGFRFDTFCKEILQYLDEHSISRVNLFGYSMGGYAALMFASLHPDRVEKVFTLNVKFNWDLESTQKETSMLDPEKMMEKVPGFANNLILQHGMMFWKEMLKNTSDMMMNMTVGKLMTDDDYQKITAPTRMAIGELDKTSSLMETLEVQQKTKQAQLLVIPGAPHPLEKIKIERILFEIEDFFQ
ncbi:MAG: alpha/beta hydrolase [Chitinophagaceae bacterium]|nr:alpha/beta hydrolase [Chitinophagaceae bacterium]